MDDPLVGQHFNVMYATAPRTCSTCSPSCPGRPIGREDVDSLNWALADMGRSSTVSQYLDTIAWLQLYTPPRRAVVGGRVRRAAHADAHRAAAPARHAHARARRSDRRRSLRASQYALFTLPFNITGQPAISLPMHWNADGLPIGTQLVAPYGREDILLRVAAQLETARPWATRRPPVFA
jgi:amidase